MKKFFKLGSNKNKGSKTIGIGSDGSNSRRSSSISSLDFASNSSFLTTFYPKIDDLSKDKHFTKLHRACYIGDLSKVERLIKKIDVNQLDSDLRSPLHLAVANAQKDVIWFLLGSKAKPNLQDSDGNTPLLKSVQCGHEEIVHFLLDRGADPNARNRNENTGLHLAARNGQTDVAMALIQKRIDVDARNEDGFTPLLVAVSNGKLEFCETLLRHGASVHLSDNSKRTCLMLACEYGSIDLVRLFLNEGVDIDASSDLGQTASDIARVTSHDDCLRLIEDELRSSKTKLSRTSHVVGSPALNNGFSDEDDERSRVSIVNSRADFDDAGLDSWDDDEASIETAPKKKVDGIGANLSKFMNEIDETVSQKSNKSDGSPPAKPKRANIPVDIEIETSPNVSEVRSKGNETVEVDEDQHFDEVPSETDEMRVKRNRDLMAELGLSDISEFSSSIHSSASKKDRIVTVEGEDTDLDVDYADEDVPKKQIKEPKNDEENQYGDKFDSQTNLMSVVASESDELKRDSKDQDVDVEVKVTDLKPTNESGGESDWDVSDDSLNETIHIQPIVFGVVVSSNHESERDEQSSRSVTTNDTVIEECKPRPNASEVATANERKEDEEVDKVDERKVNTMSSDGTLGRLGTMHEVEEVWERNQCLDPPTDENSASSGVFHAELACVNSPEESTRPEEDSKGADELWNRLWIQIFGKPPNENDSNDEVSSTFAALTDNDNGKDVPLIPELSFTDDPSNSTSAQDDGTVEVLASFVRNPVNATRVLTMVQHLRLAWNTELSFGKGLIEKINLLENEVKIARTRSESSNSAQVDLSSSLAELKQELETVKQSLTVELEHRQEASFMLQKKAEQMESLEEKYVKEVSERQKIELQLRAAQMEVENSQLLILQLREQELDGQEVVSSETLDADRKAEIHRYEEELVSIRKSLLDAEAKRTSTEEEVAELRDRVSQNVLQFAQMEEQSIVLKRKVEDVASEKDYAARQTVEDLEGKLRVSEDSLRAVEKEFSGCRRQSDESALQLDLLKQESKTNESFLGQLKETLKLQKEENKRLDTELFEAKKSLSVAQSETLTLKLQLDSNTRLDVARQETETCLQSRWEAILDKFRRDFETTEKLMTEKNLALSGTVDSLQDELRQANERMLVMRRELTGAQISVSQMTTKADGATEEVTKSSEKVTELRHSCDDLVARNDELTRQLKQALSCDEAKSAEVERVTIEMRKLEEKLLTVEANVTVTEEELGTCRVATDEERRSVQEKLLSATVKVKATEEQLMDATQKLTSALSKSEQLQVELDKTQKELKAADERSDILMEELRKSKELSVRQSSKLDGTTKDGFSMCHDERIRHTDATFVSCGPSERNGHIQMEHSVQQQHDHKGDRMFGIEKDLQELRARMDSLFEQQRPIEDVNDLCGKAEMLWRSLQEEKLKQHRSETQMSNMQDQLMEAHSLLKHVRKFQPTRNHFDGEFGRVTDRHSNCVDRGELELLARKLEVQSRLEVNQKLEQVNSFLEEQTKLSNHKEMLHSQSENNLRHEYSTAIEELKNEVLRLQKHLQDKDARQAALEEQYHELCELIEAKRRVRAKLTMDSTKRRSRGHILQANSAKQSQFLPRYSSSTLDFAAVSSVSQANVTQTLQMYPQYRMNNLRSEKIDVAADDGLSYKLREELDRTIGQHLNSASNIDIYGRQLSANNLNRAHDKAASDYLSSLKRNYLF